ncbi:MAG: hypothetical protein ACI976_002296 [Aureispira sp.]|jgi:hypothetical protein
MFMQKKYKKAGFFKEEGFSKMPSIYDLVKISDNAKRKISWKKWKYLSCSPIIGGGMGKSLLDPDVYFPQMLVTDGKWIWNTSIIYYYENNGINLPTEFEDYLNKVWMPLPIIFSFHNFLTGNKLVEEIDWKLREDEDLKKEEGIPPRE